MYNRFRHEIRKFVAVRQRNYDEMRALTQVEVLYNEKVPDLIRDEVYYGRLKNRLLRTTIGGVGIDNLSSSLKYFKKDMTRMTRRGTSLVIL